MFQRAFVLKPLAAIRPDLVPSGALESVEDAGVTLATETLAHLNPAT
jgi:7,8-dihydro-6-hydroxymethylpterin-pyrophosphokinase